MIASRLLRIVSGCAFAALLLAPSLAVHGAASTSCGIDGVERIVAVGDVHGAYDRFVEILKTAGLIDSRQRWSGGRAHLVQLGDVLDRGPDSRKVLDLLRRLEREAASAGGAVHALLGNHEVARMLGDLRFVHPGEYQAFVTDNSEQMRKRFLEVVKPADPEELLTTTPLGQTEMILAFGAKGEYGQWLRTHDAVARINGILFLHGGISPAVASTSCDDINATVRRELTTDFDQTQKAPLATLAVREDGPIFYRGLAEEPDEFGTQVDDILAKQDVRAIVIGHTVSATGRIRPRFGGKVIQLDTAMQPAYAPGGRASALEIRGNEFTAIYQDRRDPLTVASAQPVNK
jgi:calcineurin-like phosphoesterase family protein